MKRLLLFCVALALIGASLQPTPARATTPIVVDHTSVALFESIPPAYLQAARNTPMLFVDQSVGLNISEGLTCLGYASDEVAPNSCKRYNHPVPAFSVSPSEVNWTGPYTRTNWVYQTWPACGSYWYNLAGCFINSVPVLTYSVVSFQFSYLQVQAGSDIASPTTGFFVNQANRTDVYDLAAHEANNPGVTFIYWTTSLARSIGTAEAQAFNDQMRAYAVTNGKVLFDVADILSHDVTGLPCYDNRDGIPYQNENYPNDGQDYPAICQQYTSEVNGGHLGSVSAGKIRVAKAFWVLMARIAGWEP